jgi:type VI secretion system protein ImpJ
MSWSSRVVWSEGTFLQPQHFQQHDRHFEAFVESRTRPLREYWWGFAEVALDESLLELGKVGLRIARGVLPDGTPFDCPARDPLPAPLDVTAALRDSVVILGLPVRQPGVDETDLGGPGADGLLRYVTDELEIKDSNASFDRTALIQVGKLRLRLMPRVDATPAYAALGVVRVVERRADNRVVLDGSYIAPMLDATAEGTMKSYLRDIHGLLHQRGDALAERLSQPGTGGVAEIADFLWLITINHAEPVFAHLEKTSPLHPERLYAVCLALAGELSTFTRDTRRPIAYPEYQHDDLATCFRPVIEDIRRSLSMVLERNAIPIDLEDRSRGFRLALVRDSELLKTARFILAVRAQQPVEALRTGFPRVVKIGPAQRIRALVDSNMPAVALHSLPVVPRQIPYHAGFCYFELERGGELWKQIEGSGALAMHIAGEVPGLQLELWAIRG